MNIAPLARQARSCAPGRASGRQVDSAAQIQNDLVAEQALEVRQDTALQVQHAQYDFMTQERAELAREFNDTRAFILEQEKLDDEALKKYIDMI